MGRRVLIAGLVLVAGALVAVPLATATGRSGTSESAAASSATVRTATCHDWNLMDDTHRDAMVKGLKGFFGAHVDQPGMLGQYLPAADATKLLDGYCAPRYADNFRLYRLYGDAAAFHPALNR